MFLPFYAYTISCRESTQKFVGVFFEKNLLRTQPFIEQLDCLWLLVAVSLVSASTRSRVLHELPWSVDLAV